MKQDIAWTKHFFSISCWFIQWPLFIFFALDGVVDISQGLTLWTRAFCHLFNQASRTHHFLLQIRSFLKNGSFWKNHSPYEIFLEAGTSQPRAQNLLCCIRTTSQVTQHYRLVNANSMLLLAARWVSSILPILILGPFIGARSMQR